MLDHRGLDGVQARVFVGEVLDGDDLGAVRLAEQQDAGIDRLVDEAAVPHPSERDRAGAAIALRAALLGADAALLQPQIVEQRRPGSEFLDLDCLPIPKKTDPIPCHASKLLCPREGGTSQRSENDAPVGVRQPFRRRPVIPGRALARAQDP